MHAGVLLSHVLLILKFAPLFLGVGINAARRECDARGENARCLSTPSSARTLSRLEY